jgi:hypothetical protein
MFFVCNSQSVSQAECCRFDAGLPLCIAFLETMRSPAGFLLNARVEVDEDVLLLYRRDAHSRDFSDFGGCGQWQWRSGAALAFSNICDKIDVDLRKGLDEAGLFESYLRSQAIPQDLPVACERPAETCTTYVLSGSSPHFLRKERGDGIFIPYLGATRAHITDNFALPQVTNCTVAWEAFVTIEDHEYRRK